MLCLCISVPDLCRLQLCIQVLRERHLAKLLLDYGNESLVQTFTADDGSKQEQSYTVGEIIVSEIQGQQLTFSHPLCQRIFEQCALMVEMGHHIDENHFINTNDEQLRSFAAALMMDTYTLCVDSWKKKDIYTPKIEDNLLQDVEDSINLFKSQRIAQIIDQRRSQLRTAGEEQQAQLLAEIQQYTAIAHQLGQALGQVITPHYK